MSHSTVLSTEKGEDPAENPAKVSRISPLYANPNSDVWISTARGLAAGGVSLEPAYMSNERRLKTLSDFSIFPASH